MIQNPIFTRRAFLIWQRPLDDSGSRNWHAVAELCQGDGDNVSFRYFDEGKLIAVRDQGFSGYPGLPIESNNLSDIACNVLMRRLPPRDRADFPDILKRFGLPPEEQGRPYSRLSLLAYTGARMTSDNFAVCETFDGFDRPFTYIFDVVGYRHYQENNTQLEVGDPLNFRRDPTNEYDQNAVVLERPDGVTVGFVNRTQAETVGQWLDTGDITATVFRTNGRAHYPRLFVRAEVSASG